MMEPLLLVFRTPRSLRTVVIADEGDSIWAYLTQAGASVIERDCWLINKPSANQGRTLADYKTAREPPPAPPDIVDAAGVREVPGPDDWTVRWSADGNAAAVAVAGVEIGFITPRERRGLARYLTKPSPWGLPWDDDLVAESLGAVADQARRDDEQE